MRTPIALLLLSLSGIVMIAGLGFASAQPPGENTPPQDPVRVPGLRPQLKQKVEVRPSNPQQPAQPQQPQQPQQPGQPGVGVPGQPPAQPPAQPPTKQPGQPGLTQPGQPGQTGPGQEWDTVAGVEYEPMSPRALVTFNLEDADLPDLVRLISNITGKRFILPGKARSIKATVYAPTKVTAAEAYQAFLSILETNGMTVVPHGRYLKIVDSQGIENEPIPFQPETPTAPEDRFVTRMHRLQNVSAEDVVQLLTRFKSPEGNVTAYAPTNVVFITDTGTNIRRMLRLIEEIDIPAANEHIWIERVYYRSAAEIAEKLSEIFPVGQSGGGGGGDPAGGGATRPRPPRPGKAEPTAGAEPGNVGTRVSAVRITKIIPDDVTNSIIIMATERAYFRIMQMIRVLDQPGEGEGSIHVHAIQNGDAEDIASTLQSLMGGGGAGSRQTKSKQGPTKVTPGGVQAPGVSVVPGGSSATISDVFTGDIRVTAHVPTNSLVIVASAHDYASLRRVIERLDEPRRQVFIEAVIMELSVDRSSTLGFAFHGGIPDLPVEGSLSVLGFQAGQSLNPLASQEVLTSLAVGVQGPQIPEAQQLIGLSIPGFGVVMTALATAGDANILSTPHIMAMDNVQAEITIGDNIPLQTSGVGGALGGLGGLAGLAGLQGADATSGAAGLAGLAGLAGGLGGALPRQDVGTTIRITPHINDQNEIRMEIEEEISEAGASSGPFGAVSISRRTAKTEVMVRDMQTIVIGGLTRDRVTLTERKVPVLGDIPLLGALFRRRERTKQKRNLILFLTPYVVRDQSDLRRIFERKMQERQEFLDRYFVFGDQEYEPPVDYSRTRGLVLEIINEVDAIAVERQILEDARGVPPPEHVPRAPIGTIEPGEARPAEGDVVIVPDGGDVPPGGPPDTNSPTPDIPQILVQPRDQTETP